MHSWMDVDGWMDGPIGHAPIESNGLDWMRLERKRSAGLESHLELEHSNVVANGLDRLAVGIVALAVLALSQELI